MTRFILDSRIVRRFITAIFMLFLIIVAGMTLLLSLIDPNSFRDYIVKQTQEQTGYHLNIDGDLRWHVWPQLSILVGPVSVSQPASTQPILIAENMRVDVEVFPLLSRELRVKQIMLKNAVIHAALDSKLNTDTISPNTSLFSMMEGWIFDVGAVKIVDSLLVWQLSDGEEINFRDLNIDLTQDTHKHAAFALQTKISRDQRELKLFLKGKIDGTGSPQDFSVRLDDLTWDVKGTGLAEKGIQGRASLNVQWVEHKQLIMDELSFSIGEEKEPFQGRITASFTDVPVWNIRLKGAKLDLDELFGFNIEAAQTGLREPLKQRQPPVIANTLYDNILNEIKASLQLQLAMLRWRGLDLSHINLDARNDQGVIHLDTFEGRSGQKGIFRFPGKADTGSEQIRVLLQPDLQNMPIAPFLRAFEFPDSIEGFFDVKGNLEGEGISLEAFRHQWKGNAKLYLTDVSLTRLDFQKMIQRVVSSNTEHISVDDLDDNSTPINKISVDASLQDGVFQIANLEGQSPRLHIDGKGQVDILKENSDITFGIRAVGGWYGENQELIELIEKSVVPLRIYGKWNDLKYDLQVLPLLQKLISREVEAKRVEREDKGILP